VNHSELFHFRDVLPADHFLKRGTTAEDKIGDGEAAILRVADFGWTCQSSGYSPAMRFGDPATLPEGHPCRNLVPHSQLFVRERRPCLVLGESNLPFYAKVHVASLTRDFHRLAVDNLAELEARWAAADAAEAKAGPEAAAAHKLNRDAMDADLRVVDLRLTAQLRD
jgi:hypothetical protein